MPKVGSIDRFASVCNFAFYARYIDSQHISNGKPENGLASECDRHKSVQSSLDAKRYQRSSEAAKPPGRKQSTDDRLILMGDWRDSFAAMIEETDAVQ